MAHPLPVLKKGINRMKLKTVVLSGVFIALGVLTPQIFHMFGAAAGRMFLPMHLPVLVAGLTCGAFCAGVCGLVSPVVSCFVTSMPSVVKMPFMAIELFTYGVVSARSLKFFNRVCKRESTAVYAALLTAQIAGRVVNVLCTFVAVKVVGIKNPAISVQAALLSVPNGLVGVILQLIIVPVVVLAVKNYVTIGKKK